MEIAVVENKEQLESVAPTGSIIIWKGKEEIDDVLEEVGNSLDRYTKANLRLCKEVLFKKAVTVNKSNGKRFSTNSLSELLKTGLPAQEDLVIVESSDVSEAITLIQQLINLGMNTNVLTREEILKKKVIQNYFEHKNTFKEFLKQFEEKVKNTKSNFDITDELKQIFLKQLELIEKKLEESSDETIKVAVFATKKSGKSMIVNALLGEEYAPTSQELPTPNVIIYKPHNEKFLKLLYDEKEINFESADELKKFIRKEFNRVKISGDKLPVMTILYPKRKGINFEIYDTPGPDLASSQHGDFIDEYIEKADVSVFAVDYTKYAQSSEVELLKKIKDSFEKKGKIYSLVCAVNKLDMMYLDTDTEKIKVRVSYFMERKLRELGFKNFVVVPISAIIYFYLIKIAEYISEIKEVENLRSYLLDMEDNEEFLEDIANIGRGGFYHLKNVESFFGDIKDEIKEISEEIITNAEIVRLFYPTSVEPVEVYKVGRGVVKLDINKREILCGNITERDRIFFRFRLKNARREGKYTILNAFIRFKSGGDVFEKESSFQVSLTKNRELVDSYIDPEVIELNKQIAVYRKVKEAQQLFNMGRKKEARTVINEVSHVLKSLNPDTEISQLLEDIKNGKSITSEITRTLLSFTRTKTLTKTDTE